jgi:hypothetical protein
MSFADHASARRVVALVAVVACARNPSVRGVGLAPDYRRWAVQAGELPATRWARHEAFARPELCEQIAGLYAKSYESAELVPALPPSRTDGRSVHMWVAVPSGLVGLIVAVVPESRANVPMLPPEALVGAEQVAAFWQTCTTMSGKDASGAINPLLWL